MLVNVTVELCRKYFVSVLTQLGVEDWDERSAEVPGNGLWEKTKWQKEKKTFNWKHALLPVRRPEKLTEVGKSLCAHREPGTDVNRDISANTPKPKKFFWGVIIFMQHRRVIFSQSISPATQPDLPVPTGKLKNIFDSLCFSFLTSCVIDSVC